MAEDIKMNTKFLLVVSISLLFFGIFLDNYSTYLVFQKDYDYAVENEYNPYLVNKVKTEGMNLGAFLSFDIYEMLNIIYILAIASMISFFWFVSFLKNFQPHDRMLIVFSLGMQLFAVIKISAGLNNLFVYLTI